MFIYEVLCKLGLYNGPDCRDELLNSSELMTRFLEWGLYLGGSSNQDTGAFRKCMGAWFFGIFQILTIICITSKADWPENVLAVEFPFPVSLPVCFSFTL